MSAAHIRNPHTRKAYAEAAAGFAAWCDAHGIGHLRDVEPVHVAAQVEDLQLRMAAPSVNLQLAGLRMLFDWLVVGQIISTNPASAVRGPKHSVRTGKTPVLTAGEARELLDSIVTDTLAGLRDRALIALMTYAFARVGAVLKMRAEDVFIQGRRMRWASTASFRLWGPHYEWPGAAKLLIPFRFLSLMRGRDARFRLPGDGVCKPM